MKTLLIDIETAPNMAHVWSLWRQNVSLSQLRESSKTICFASKWLDKPKVTFSSVHGDGYEDMIAKAYALVSEADAIMTYNGVSFDLPTLNNEFIRLGYGPPSPSTQIDLLKAVRKQFRWPSNKLDYVAQELGVGGKVKHEGHDLWVKCLAGDDAAWKRMASYNKQDVLLLEKLYYVLQPWIVGHPHRGLFNDNPDSCGNCGKDSLIKQGFSMTSVGKYQRFQCTECGKWSRSGSRLGGVDIRGVA